MKQKALPPGSAVDDRYVIRTPIGVGGFGAVYSALDRVEKRPVALKILLPKAAKDPELLERFHQEARICSELKHPNTASLYEVGHAPTSEQPDPVHFIAFELVRGLSLGHILAIRPQLTPDESIHVIVETLKSVGEAHQMGVIHRDLKPANILLEAPEESLSEPVYDSNDLCTAFGIPDPDHEAWTDLTRLHVRVCDFGLAKLLPVKKRRTEALTLPGVAPGNAQYMSPEQVKGKTDLDYRVDIYGLGMLLYRLVVGEHAYPGDSMTEVCMKHLHDPLPTMPKPFKGTAIEEVFRMACAKKRENRYPAAAVMAWTLECVRDPVKAEGVIPDFELPPNVEWDKPSWRERIFGKT